MAVKNALAYDIVVAALGLTYKIFYGLSSDAMQAKLSLPSKSNICRARLVDTLTLAVQNFLSTFKSEQQIQQITQDNTLQHCEEALLFR